MIRTEQLTSNIKLKHLSWKTHSTVKLLSSPINCHIFAGSPTQSQAKPFRGNPMIALRVIMSLRMDICPSSAPHPGEYLQFANSPTSSRALLINEIPELEQMI